MKKKKIIMTVLQFALIIGFAFSFYSYVQNETQPTTVFIYTASIEDINTQIQKEHIKAVTIPASAVTADFARNEKDIIGKYITSKVYDGQYVYSRNLVEKEYINVFDSMDLSKYRKISLPISYLEGFSGNVKKGDVVDLVFSNKDTAVDEQGDESEFTYAKTFLQNVLVYSVNTEEGFQFIDHSGNTPDTYGVEDTETLDVEAVSEEMAIITLAVTLEQAEEINARKNDGTISFLGRFDASSNYETLGFVIGDYDKVFSGPANAETGVVELEEDKKPEAPKK